jgi:hypothetical protein
MTLDGLKDVIVAAGPPGLAHAIGRNDSGIARGLRKGESRAGDGQIGDKRARESSSKYGGKAPAERDTKLCGRMGIGHKGILKGGPWIAPQ